MSLIVGPVVLLVATLKLFGPHDYPVGDIRNEPMFWLVLWLGAALLVSVSVVGSIRELRRSP